MTEPVAPITPTVINLHKKSRVLEVAFSDGLRFNRKKLTWRSGVSNSPV